MLLLGYLAVTNPASQTWIAKKITKRLSKNLQTEISIRKVRIHSLKELTIKDLLIRDLEADTLGFISSLNVQLKSRNPDSNLIHFRSILLKDSYFNIVNYEGYEGTNLQFLIDYFTPEQPDTSSKSIQLIADQVTLSSNRLNFTDHVKSFSDAPMKYGQLEIKEISMVASNLIYKEDTLFGMIQHLEASEQSGLQLKRLSTELQFCPYYVNGQQTILETNQSLIETDLEMFFDDGIRDIQSFIDSVQIKATIRPSTLWLSDLKYFSETLNEMENEVRIGCEVKGTVSNFKAKNLQLGFGNNTYFKGKANISGLPEIRASFSRIAIQQFYTNAEDIQRFKLPGNQRISIPSSLDKFGKVSIQGNFTGFYNDFVSYADFSTKMGNFSTDIKLNVNRLDTVEYDGTIIAKDFNLGNFIELEPILGKISATAYISGSGLDFESINMDINGHFHTVGVNNEVINEVGMNGNLSHKKFVGYLSVNDDIANLDFDGILDFQQSIPSYRFISKIKYLYLDRLKITEDSATIFSGDIDINMMGADPDNLQGILKLNSPSLQHLGKLYQLGNLSLSITNQEENFRVIRLFSDIADASVEGNINISHIFESAMLFMDQYLDTVVDHTRWISEEPINQSFVFDIKTKNTGDFIKILTGKTLQADELNLKGTYNDEDNFVAMGLSCPAVYINGRRLEDLQISVDNNDDTLFISGKAPRFWLSDTIEVKNLKLKTYISNNTVSYQTGFGKSFSPDQDFAILRGQVNIHSKNSISAGLQESSLQINGETWNISKNNLVKIDTSAISFSDFEISNDRQKLQLSGTLSENKSDTLISSFENFNLSNFDILLQPLKLDFDGIIDGAFSITGIYDTANYLTQLVISDFYMNGEKLGDANIQTNWDKNNNQLNIASSIIYTGNVGSHETFQLSGAFYPKSPIENFNIEISCDNYKLKTLEPFTEAFASRIDGLASGKLFLRGTLSQPELTGKIDITRGQMLIDYTNCTYYFADPVYLEKDQIYFDTITIYDTLNNKGYARGKITHRHFKDWNFDISIITDKLAGMNTTMADNEMFYGKAMAKGIVKIYGPLDHLVLDMNIAPEKGTSITIPINTATELVNNDYIIFVDKQQDTTPRYFQPPSTTQNIEILTNLDINPNALLQLIMPYDMGKITGRGTGNLSINMDKNQDLVMEGTYTINEGVYYMSLQNIINRNFKIQENSKVIWEGDPYNAKLDIEAIYNLKTSLGAFGPEADSSTKVPVNCIIHLKNDLAQPDIHFSIDFPTLEENTKQIVFSKLDTTDQSNMNKQIVSLLVLNSFNTNIEYGSSLNFNTFAIFTNQINNWLSQISKDFDIGINYRPGDAITEDEVGVALSTQLFNDRVTINGNVDVKGTENQETANNIVGEVDIEVKITPDGKLKAKFFNQSNNDYLMENYTPYTQGVGVFYTHEFEKFSDLFTKKNKKE